MSTAVEIARRAFLLGLFCGTLIAGTGCTQLSGDPLDEVRGLHARNRYEESLEDLRALMDEDPSDLEVNFLLGKTLMHIGEPSMAIWPLRKAVESSEYAFDASMLLARATLDSRTPEDSIASVDIALAVDPDNVEALALRAHANLESARYAEALADVERAVELDSENPAILIPHVLVLLEFERVDEAEAALDAGKRMAETTEEQVGEEIQAKLCLTNAAFAVANGDNKSAEVMYADCLDAYPTHQLVVLHAVDFYDAIDQQERATALLRRTFEETGATQFGYALARRVKRLRDEERLIPTAPKIPEILNSLEFLEKG
jgi:tetratricopeptide (TPR) repeat protein